MRDIGLSRLDFLKVAFTASMILWASIVATPASAVTIQYSFTGNVTQVNNQLTSAFRLSPNSSTMSGLLTVNTTDTNILNANLGSYMITNFTLNIGSYTATMGTSGTIEIRNGPPGTDQFNLTMNTPNGSAVNFLAPRLFEIQLRGPNRIFTSDALPPSSPTIASFTNQNLWRLVFGAGNRAVSGVITTVTAMTAVPVPSTAVLFGGALVALVSFGAGNWKQRKPPRA